MATAWSVGFAEVAEIDSINFVGRPAGNAARG
jgi:hypothetical protein